MNREIKFKGKNKDIGWVFGQLAYGLNGETYIIEEVELDNSYGLEETILYPVMWYRVDPKTIGQFTELYDKNEKEIWESDIVEITREGIYEKGIIIFKNGCFFIKSKENLLALYNCELNNYKVKVIGNITELLGGE